MDAKLAKFIAFLVVAVVVIVLIIILCSFAIVEPNHIALIKNKWSIELDTETYGQGWHWKGPLGATYVFPTYYEKISFSSTGTVNSRTSDGLEIGLNGEIYYRINPDDVFTVFSHYLLGYEDFMRYIAKSAIRNTANKYEATDYQEKFEEIVAQMESDLVASFDDEGFVLEYFCVTSYDLPDDFEAVLLDIAVEDQEINIAYVEQEAESTGLNVSIDVATAKAQQQLTTRIGAANVTLVEAEGGHNATLIGAEAEAAALLSLTDASNEFGISTVYANLDEYLRYMYLRVLRDQANLHLTLDPKVIPGLEL